MTQEQIKTLTDSALEDLIGMAAEAHSKIESELKVLGKISDTIIETRDIVSSFTDSLDFEFDSIESLISRFISDRNRKNNVYSNNLDTLHKEWIARGIE